jgi:hypothetical protein
MSDGGAAESRMQQFADVARNFAPVPPKRFAQLLPLREGIAELRQKGASFALIRELLATVGVEVAADTVRRFYRGVIEEPRTAAKTSRRRERASPSAAPIPILHAEAPTSAPQTEPQLAREPPRGRGPRIADPRNL